MPNRTDLLNYLIEKYDLKSYLEIGVQVPALNFDKIECEYKVGVDPDPDAKATFCCTSDHYFQYECEFALIDTTCKDDNGECNFIDQRVDLIFIDGLHTAEQVKKDFENSLNILSPKGFIVLHDCNPEKEEHTIVPRPTPTGHWNGDVYKFACELGYYYKKFFTVDIDNGCGVWANSGEDVMKDMLMPGSINPFASFDRFRKELLNLISWDEFIQL